MNSILKGALPGADRNPSSYTLWWTSGDGQSSLFIGNFESEECAMAAMPALEAEFRDQCSDETPYDEDSTWDVEPPEDDEEQAIKEGFWLFAREKIGRDEDEEALEQGRQYARERKMEQEKEMDDMRD